MFKLSMLLAAVATARNLDTYSFEEYTKEFGKVYTGANYETRKALFEARMVEVRAHNAMPGQTFTKGVNHMSDWTDAEFKGLRGYKKGLATAHRATASEDSFARFNLKVEDLPDAVDWREKGAITPVKNQGKCGSCWTFAAASSIESHYFLATGQIQELSQQQIAGCTANPLHCGGKGGCEGGIAQLAFKSVVNAGGLATEWTYPYVSYFGTNFDCVLNLTEMGVGASISGYKNVLSNDYSETMAAIATQGPLSISVDASNWHSYDSGVFSDCNVDTPDIDHAVQLVGYGTDATLGPYWLIRNSWGPTWGEGGYIRLARPSSEKEVCGLDVTPQDGSGCDDGPSNITVCGMCGILYDNTFPVV